MGVPKFFRYISERYPCLSEVVKEYQIPDFDNLYLDMNGIIHVCSHPDDYDPQLRLTQEKVFRDIFHFIEVLFRIIRPQKIFFMAIDGVAPRAKMNQQRSRRFRTAKEAERVIAKARERGHVLPDEEPFDSNCITPGTEFMARLHEQLKYFIVDKISKDTLWQNCKIIFSGHETPGEGEHKIMDYIRYLRAQPGYDPNTRHCLYGLDADLIMLGLCTHDPHFSLLREEVKFGKKNSKRKHIPEELTFYLLHLSLMREYLEQEFIQLKDKLPFEFDLEKIIDDWVLMGFLVGNDFIPHLPNMHIVNGSLQLLYNTYIELLPTLDGYINESGTLNLARFEKFMLALCAADLDYFSEQYADLKYFESKTGRRPNEAKRTSYNSRTFEEWPNNKFSTAQKESTSTAQMPSDLAALISATERMFSEPSAENVAKLQTTDEITNDDLFEVEFQQYKRDYYMNKLEFSQVTPEILNDQAEGYIRAIQWILNYYYNGVCSWSWFYPHHYAPFITDIKNFKDMKIDFDLGTPFTAFEQLLAVLPTASKKLLPTCYQKLMHDECSPIKDFYPDEFITDLNGKKQDWEAIVLIPFIDEKRLLSAMKPCHSLLTVEETKRNTHGPMLLYEFTEKDMGRYAAPEFFPIVQHSHAMRTDIFIQDIKVQRLVKGAYPGALFDIYYPGFPTLKHLNFKSELRKGNVKVFDQPSRSENMIVQLEAKASNDIKEVANRILGQIVFVNWPHLQEALVTSVSCPTLTYNANSNRSEENRENVRQTWECKANEIAERHHTRLGIDIGDTKILVHVKLMTGRKYVFTTQGGIKLEKQWTDATSVIPWQTVVTDVATYNPTFKKYQRIEDIYSVNSTCYFLGLPNYGYQATIQDIEATRKGRVKISLNVTNEPDFTKVFQLAKELQTSYMQVRDVVTRCGLTKRAFSQITGCLLISMGPKRAGLNDDAPKQNIGLNLKFNAKNEEIPGYTKKSFTWLYSQKAINLVMDYKSAFPVLFAFLDAHGGNDYFECDIFPEDNGSGESVRKILSWLKEQPYYSVEKQTCGSRSLDPEVVKLIETSVDAYKQNVVTQIVTTQVRPNLLYKPGLYMGNIPPDCKATYHLYDRVVNVRESYTVPLGYSGTIIAIHAAQSGKIDDEVYDVVFDTPFVGGLALNCSQHRGYKMSRLAIINKSYGLNEMENKTGHVQPTLKSIKSDVQPPSTSYQNETIFNSMLNAPNTFVPRYNLPANFNLRPDIAPGASINMKQPTVKREIQLEAGNVANIQTASGSKQNTNTFYKSHPSPKKILPRIDKSGQTDLVPQQKQPVDGAKLSVRDIFAHASARLEQFNNSMVKPHVLSFPYEEPKLALPFSLQLMNQYTARGLGGPLFSYYYDGKNNNYQAQLVLPITKELILGPPRNSKQEASDSAAEIALKKLPQIPHYLLPIPPIQWQNSQGKQNSAPKYGSTLGPEELKVFEKRLDELELQDAKTEKQVKHRNENQKGRPILKGQAQFVPLQAVKRQRIRNVSGQSNANVSTKNSPKQRGNCSNNLAQNKEANEAAIVKSEKAKPKRERKMRLAANFSMNAN